MSLSLSFLISVSVHPSITGEQEAFNKQVLEIPSEKWKCRDLIILDTLYAYYGGPVPTRAACRLNSYSCHCKCLLFTPVTLFFFLLFGHHLTYVRHLIYVEMEAARLRAQVRACVTQQK